jgi:hypothetical protein
MTLVWRNSLEALAERRQNRPAPSQPEPPRPREPHNADLAHCLAVLRANQGRGFPFIDGEGAGGRDAVRRAA